MLNYCVNRRVTSHQRQRREGKEKGSAVNTYVNTYYTVGSEEGGRMRRGDNTSGYVRNEGHGTNTGGFVRRRSSLKKIRNKEAGMREKTREEGGAGKSGQMRESRVRRID